MGAINFCSEQKRPFLGPLAPLDQARRFAARPRGYPTAPSVVFLLCLRKSCGCKQFLLRAEKTLPWPISATRPSSSVAARPRGYPTAPGVVFLLCLRKSCGCKQFLLRAEKTLPWPISATRPSSRLQLDQGFIRLLRVCIFIVFEKVLWVQTIFAQSRKDPSLAH